MAVGTATTISVIIPAFDCAGWIEKAIRSVEAQTRPVDEIIVVDDASSDNLRETVNAVNAAHLPIRYVQHEVNRGPSAARNTGARMATADYLLFLDADDRLAPDAIAKMLQALHDTGASWCITDILRVEGNKTFLLRSTQPYDDPLESILTTDFVMSGIFFRAADFRAIGMYDETLRAREDWDISIRMIEAGKQCYLAEPLYEYHRREGSISTGQPERMLACTKHVLKKHHRRIARKNRNFNQIRAAALWHLGRMHWEANHRFTAIYYALASTLRARSFRHVRAFLGRRIR